jgi:hypothetical protein
MYRQEKQIPSSTEGLVSNGVSKYNEGTNGGNISKRLASGSSKASNGQTKRNTYGSGNGSTNGTKRVDPNDDLFIRLLAQRALTESNENHILNPEEIDDLKNVCQLQNPLSHDRKNHF